MDEVVDSGQAASQVEALAIRIGVKDIAPLALESLAQFRQRVKDSLSTAEATALYREARRRLKEARLFDARLVGRNSPLLKAINSLNGGGSHIGVLGYEDELGGRSSRYTRPGTVSSMFSPAAYLTELYREARHLHGQGSPNHIDNRRPDLKQLVLSQDNLDTEVPALELCNEVLISKVSAVTNHSVANVPRHLSERRISGQTPYHDPYTRVRESLRQKAPEFPDVEAAPRVLADMRLPRAAMEMDISPEDWKLLTQEIPYFGAEALFQQNFGANISAGQLMSVSALARWYQCDEAQIRALIAAQHSYMEMSSAQLLLDRISLEGDRIVPATRGPLMAGLTPTPGLGENEEDVDDLEFAHLYYTGDGQARLVLRFKSVEGARGVGRQVFARVDNGAWQLVNRGDVYTWPGVTVDGTVSGIPVDITGNIVMFPLRLRRHTNAGILRYNMLVFQSFGDDEDRFHRRWLVRFNVFVRLWRATGFTPLALRQVVGRLTNESYRITGEVLERLARAKHYMRRYGVGLDDAMVLCGAEISTFTEEGEVGQFDRIFNSPPLDGFHLPKSTLTLNLNPAHSDYSNSAPYHRSLCAAFNVDGFELHLLANMLVAGTNTLNIQNYHYSGWYRILLIARVHGLSIMELSLLWQACGYGGSFVSLNLAQLDERIEATYRAVQDLRSMGITPYELWAMTTTQFPATLTPEMRNFLQGLQAIEVSPGNDNALPAALAPAAAILLELPSAETAHAVLQWVGQLRPAQLTLQAYWQRVKDEKYDDASVITFTHALLQRAWVARQVALPASALLLFVNQPQRLDAQEGHVLGTLMRTLMTLHHCARWLDGLGDGATDTLAEFIKEGGLTLAGLAAAIKRQGDGIASAASQAKERGQIQNNQRLASWAEIDVVLQWLALGDLLQLPPTSISGLLDLSYEAAAEVAPWDSWRRTADLVQVGLSTDQAAALDGVRLPRLTAALCSVLMTATGNRALPPEAALSREALYGYLLLDNLNSTQIRTTRIAEAIASVQLHIHRTLSSVEPLEAEHGAALSRQFFIDWQQYNSRYSTWAGVSKLVYYPENYIDPTVRHGQTALMTDMLQQLGQAQLNVDTVGDAFQAYLSGFEEVANLRVISGYHDGLDAAKGKTYLVGQSDAGEYYWRSVDENMRPATGVLPANAWTGWQKIGCAPAPLGELIRPVVFKSRLHVCWLERRDVTPPGADGQLPDPGPARTYQYEIKISYLRYDGGWSVPRSIDVSNQTVGAIVNANPALYCSHFHTEDVMVVVLYKKPDDPGGVPTSGNLYGFRVRGDMTVDRQGTGYGYETILATVQHELDRAGLKRINNALQQKDLSVPAAVPFSSESSTSGRFNGSIQNISTTGSSGTKLSISMNISFDAILPGPWQLLALQLTEAQLSGARRFGDPNLMMYALVSAGGNVFTHGVDPSERVLIVHQGGTTYASFVVAEPNGVSAYHSDIPASTMYYMFIIDRYGTRITTLAISNDGISQGSVSVEFNFDGERVVKRYADHVDAASYFGDWFAQVRFARFSIDVSKDLGSGARKEIHFRVTAGGASTSGKFAVTAQINAASNVIALTTTAHGAQYMQRLAYRTRLNTLFARNLVARAQGGTAAILNIETQRMGEPQLGPGGYVQLRFPAYDAALHGDSPAVRIRFGGAYTVWSGMLDRSTRQIRLFVPYSKTRDGAPINEPSGSNFYNVSVSYGVRSFMVLGSLLFQDDSSGSVHISDYSNSSNWNANRDPRITVDAAQGHGTEEMDFTGANALYFWELFYYTPMMIAQRMLDEQRFDDAQRWLNYVWSPSGHLVRDEAGEIEDWTERQWNVRPLLEDHSWNSDPLDSVDPDAVAQHDPMHYKVATFMRALDILIARGDAAYRRLERDSLNEAKMWYSQALNLLGDRPFVERDPAWSAPTLQQAANESALSDYWAVLSRIMRGTAGTESMENAENTENAADTADAENTENATEAENTADTENIESTENAADAADAANTPDASDTENAENEAATERSANSLLKVFVPEVNEMLFGYWDTLAARMHNLRNNLSMDGQPLTLPLYAAPADPKALQTAAVAAANDGGALPIIDDTPELRFAVMLESAKGMVSQLIGLGASIRTVIESHDAEALSLLLQNQAGELMLSSLKMQGQTLMELEADDRALAVQLTEATARRDHYGQLYAENVSARERSVLDAVFASQVSEALTKGLYVGAAVAGLAPNIFGLANGGMKWEGPLTAVAKGLEIAGDMAKIVAYRMSMEEGWRRRRQEWELQHNSAVAEVRQLGIQREALKIRQESARLHKIYLETQQLQAQAQLAFLQTKFSNQALYSWLRARLATVFYRYYDLTVSRCLMAQRAFMRELGEEAADFIKPGAWQTPQAGQACGETLLLGLTRMEDAYLKRDTRGLEVRRTVSLKAMYEGLGEQDGFVLGEAVAALVKGGGKGYGNRNNAVTMEEQRLLLKLSLDDLRLRDDYPHHAGKRRRIKHISVSLPTLLGAYQDIQAELSYIDTAGVSKGIYAMAVSHGMEDDGLFHLDFNDGRFLPFEGVNADTGVLTLSFPNPTGKQRSVLENINDAILHIRYTIR